MRRTIKKLRRGLGLGVLFILVLLWSCENFGNEAISVTGDCTDVGETSAKLYGWCYLDGVDGASVVYGMEYSNTDLTTDAMTITGFEKDSKNKYCCQVYGLISNTLYYYRAYTLNNGTRTYGEVKTFKTRDFTSTVATMDATDITEIGATLNGTISINSKDNLRKECGFLISDIATTVDALKNDGWLCYGTLSEDGTFRSYAHEKGFVGKGGGDISLKWNTQYFYVAVASVENRTIYGDVKTFTTLDVPCEVITKDAVEVTDYSAILHGMQPNFDSKEVDEKRVGFYYSSTATTLDDLEQGGKQVFCDLLDDGSFNISISGLPANTHYKYVAFLEICLGGHTKSFFGEVKSFSLLEIPEVVDLGLSVKWRSWNLGASSPEESGDYYAWGEIEPKSNYYWSSYKWCNGSSTSLTKYNTDSSKGIVDNKTILDPEDDVAHVILGDNWRMPTSEEWSELNRECTITIFDLEEKYHGIARGRLYTAQNGNSIFIPLAGAKCLEIRGVSGRYEDDGNAYYWSSSLDERCYEAGYMHFSGRYSYGTYNVYRSSGLTVRPVYEN